MSSEIRFTEHFKKEYKKLAKKYVSLKNDVLSLVETLKEKAKAAEQELSLIL